jgi:hypothetical protein
MIKISKMFLTSNINKKQVCLEEIVFTKQTIIKNHGNDKIIFSFVVST